MDTSGTRLLLAGDDGSAFPLEFRECDTKGFSETAKPGLKPSGGDIVIRVGSVILAGRGFLNLGSSASGRKPTLFLSFGLVPPALPGRLCSILLRWSLD